MRERTTMWFCCVFLTLVINIQDVVTDITYVERHAAKDDNTDVFGPVEDAFSECYSYNNALSNGKYECICPYDKSTFLCSSKTCKSNKFIESIPTTAVCQRNQRLLFRNQHMDSPYSVFDLKNESDTQYSRFKKVDDQIITKIEGEKCNISQIYYLDDCDGNCKTSTAASPFIMDKTNKKLTWNISLVPSGFHGRVIKLTTTDCTVTFNPPSSNPVYNPCFIFKAKGRQHCSSLNTVSTPPAPTPLSPSPVMSIKPGSLTLTPTKPSTSIGSTLPIAPSKPPNSNKENNNKQNSNKQNNNKENSKKSVPVGAIVGPVLAAIVVIIIIILIIIWRRRYQRQNTKSTAKGAAEFSNQDYGNETINISRQRPQCSESKGNEQEYDYAAIDGNPSSHGNQPTNQTAPNVYQSLTKDAVKDSVYTPLSREPGPPDQTYAYNKTERPFYNPQRKGTTDPLYNVLDRSNNHDPGKRGEKGPSSKETTQNNEPVYNTLEDPNQGDEPEYNVPEDPDSGYDYAQVGSNIRHPSSCDNIGYESTLGIKPKPAARDPEYAVLEGPSSEPSYQSLQTKVPEERVYQPLDRTSRNLEQPLYHVLEDDKKHSRA